MSENCPFCGAQKSARCNDTFIEFDCQTYQAHEGTGEPYWDRQQPCYERQLAALAAQNGAMREIVNRVAKGTAWPFCVHINTEYPHIVIKQAQALLSTPTETEWVGVRREDLEMIMGVGPKRLQDISNGKFDEAYSDMWNRLQAVLKESKS